MGIRTTPERLASLITVDPLDPINGCWRWGGFVSPRGYARVGKERRYHQVHRLLYELVIGPVPDGLVLDHTCRNRACVNFRHVEPVTNRENIMRGDVPSANRELCKAGHHVLIEVGIYVDSEGTERCHECRLESKRRYHARQRRVAASISG